MIKTIFSLALTAALSGCADPEPSDKIIKEGYALLKKHYALAVKPADSDPYSTKCTYKEFEGRYFAGCGFYYGGIRLVRRGKWEIINEKGTPGLLALNGKAVVALNQIWAYRAERGIYGNFRIGYRRPSVDPSVFPD